MGIYFDYAATSLKKPQAVAQEISQLLLSETCGNPSRGAHDFSLNGYRKLYQAKERLKTFFNLPSSAGIGYTMNATMALNMAIQGLFQPGDHVITTNYEHNSVLRPLYLKEKQGVELSFVPCDKVTGKIHYDEIEKLIQPNTKGIVCTHASNVIGNVIDLRKISTICQKHDLLFIVDASQTAGSLPIDVQDLGIDVLCFTGHKSLYGPQGIGGICFKEALPFEPLLVGGSGVHSQDKIHPHDYPTVLEAGTTNLLGIVGLDASLKELMEQGLDKVHQKQMAMANRFYEGIKGLEKVTFYGDYEATCRTGIVSFNIGNLPSAEIADYLNETYEIAVRPGLHCAPLVHEAMGTTHQGMVRFSFSHYHTEEEVDQAIQAVQTIYEKVEESLL
ncbi:aminotransferase class V-fold PLP-dependent enzyme [Vagococcus humatus]|uniref:cysteine desulfurase n=1 Tax=Vagococcus humatus TaxID=1889241 RepID=A0A429Z918_9ENTE|nr:aminotransferase class V-fold PLP-dependent enzyme [Vagococcus humatus]RST90166.1 cysteine desulfurase [Vagococcus humatus]